LNILLLALVVLVFARLQFRFDLGSFLLAPARERIVSVSRLAALQLPDTPTAQWSKLMQQYASRYPAHFYVFRDDGTELAGEAIELPAEFLKEMKRDPFAHSGPPPGMPPPRPEDNDSRPPNARHRPPFFGHGPGPGPREFEGGPVWAGPRHGGLPDAPLDVLKTNNPTQYWVGVRIPIWTPGLNDEANDPVHATLVWRFGSLWTEPFFFDVRPWMAVTGIVLLISCICWVPLVRGLTHSISRFTAATRQIADGHFDVQLPTKRRDELGLLSESINRMASRLSGYVHGQKRFLGDIAHELSSPLARMQMALGILEHRATEQDVTYVADLREEAEHMATLVNELLSFSKSEVTKQPIELQPVSISDILKRVLTRESSPGVTVEQDVQENLIVAGDPEFLFRALANVLRNAIRYAGSAGPIHIVGRQEGGRVRITVSDSGPGIADDELENVFRAFYRPEFARTRETGGTGLGLAIVRDCVEACGGHVECRNRVPHGLEVVIELAVDASSATDAV
jgi:two-component system sensor histidine kinase CpxA